MEMKSPDFSGGDFLRERSGAKKKMYISIILI